PPPTDFSFCDEIGRASRSAPDNISEGFYRFNPREFHRFLNDAKASLGEVRNQLLHAKSRGYLNPAEPDEMWRLMNRALGAANRPRRYLRNPRKTHSEQPSKSPNPGATLEPRTQHQNPEPLNVVVRLE